MAKKVKVDPAEIKKLEGQKVKTNETRDAIDAADRCLGRIISKIGKYFDPNDGEFWK